MRRSTMRFIVAGASAIWLAAPAPAAEQTTRADVERSGDTWNTIKSDSLDKKSEAVAYGKQLMKETDARIAQLEAKAAKVSGAAKGKFDQEIEALKVTRANTAAKLDKLEKESGDAWNEAKQGFADAYQDLQSAYKKVIGKFR